MQSLLLLSSFYSSNDNFWLKSVSSPGFKDHWIPFRHFSASFPNFQIEFLITVQKQKHQQISHKHTRQISTLFVPQLYRKGTSLHSAVLVSWLQDRFGVVSVTEPKNLNRQLTATPPFWQDESNGRRKLCGITETIGRYFGFWPSYVSLLRRRYA